MKAAYGDVTMWIKVTGYFCELKYQKLREQESQLQSVQC